MISKVSSVSLLLGLTIALTACNKAAVQETLTTPPKMVAVETSTPEDNLQAFSASYSDYQADEAQGQKHILFLHADWCPTCVKWDKKIKENMATLGDDVLIYKADYDTAEDLKAQYEITKQSTAVFVNADGSVAKKEMDPSLESVNAFFANDTMESEKMMDDHKMGEAKMMEKDTAETFSATYTDFDSAASAGQKHILFFHAPWCPTCVK